MNKYNPDIGPTTELSLRVSVATLARVLFEHPQDGTLMLALERKATLMESGVVVIKAQPLGGAIRIRDLGMMRDLIGDFHFDGERSRSEQDFRIFIKPSAWEVVREFCIEHFNHDDDPVLETDPRRELAEEFADALKISLKPDQYSLKLLATVVENDPLPTDNIHARGSLTARVYRIFEAHITDASLSQTMLANSESLSHQDLYELALQDAQKGGKGRANAILALPLKHISEVYFSMPPKERNAPILFENHHLGETVPIVLDNIILTQVATKGS